MGNAINHHFLGRRACRGDDPETIGHHRPTKVTTCRNHLLREALHQSHAPIRSRRRLQGSRVGRQETADAGVVRHDASSCPRPPRSPEDRTGISCHPTPGGLRVELGDVWSSRPLSCMTLSCTGDEGICRTPGNKPMAVDRREGGAYSRPIVSTSNGHQTDGVLTSKRSPSLPWQPAYRTRCMKTYLLL